MDGAVAKHNYKGPSCYIERQRCAGGTGFQSVRWAAAASICAVGNGWLSRRLKFVACQVLQRGAGGFRGRPKRITGPWQARRWAAAGAAPPNPSLKWSANGRPPGPRYSAGVHFL